MEKFNITLVGVGVVLYFLMLFSLILKIEKLRELLVSREKKIKEIESKIKKIEGTI